MKMKNTWRIAASVAMAAAVCTTGTAKAQDTISTGDGMLSLTANMPKEVRAGEEFTYDIKVTNTSDNVTLHDIKLKQLKATGFSVASTSMQSAGDKSEGSTDDKAKQDAVSGEKNQAKAKDDTSEADAKAKAKNGDNAKSDAKKESSQSNDSDKKKSTSSGEMMISVLKPGESKTINVKASADEQGDLRSCLAIVDYTPAICLTSKVVKPELELTKTAPKNADRCKVIELEYLVKNGGTGDVGKFMITDSLGKGLATIEGNDKLKFEVDGLKAGDSRKFVARVFADEPGTFASRAMAAAEGSELKSRSKETTTKVVAADLRVKVEGPKRLYGDQLAKFTAHVTNSGNASANKVNVNVSWPQACELADMGEPTMETSQENSKDMSNEGQSEPTVAKDAAKQASGNGNGNSKKKAAGSDMAMSDQSFEIENLEPGQTAVFEYAIRTGDVETLPTKVVAQYVCSIDGDAETDREGREVVATGMANAKVVRLPALQLVVLDDEDPVAKGSNVVYTIRVWNEGDADDNQVVVNAELPQGLEFVSASGPSEHKQDGRNLTFEPIETLKAGDCADYKVTAKSTGNGEVRFSATLQSKSLKEKVSGEEPTTLFDQTAESDE